MMHTHTVSRIFVLPIVALVFAGCAGDANVQQSSDAQSGKAVPTAAVSASAQTQYGRVRGLNDNGVFKFKGIRYGRDTATTRFAAPAKPRRTRCA